MQRPPKLNVTPKPAGFHSNQKDTLKIDTRFVPAAFPPALVIQPESTESTPPAALNEEGIHISVKENELKPAPMVPMKESISSIRDESRDLSLLISNPDSSTVTNRDLGKLRQPMVVLRDPPPSKKKALPKESPQKRKVQLKPKPILRPIPSQQGSLDMRSQSVMAAIGTRLSPYSNRFDRLPPSPIKETPLEPVKQTSFFFEKAKKRKLKEQIQNSRRSVQKSPSSAYNSETSKSRFIKFNLNRKSAQHTSDYYFHQTSSSSILTSRNVLSPRHRTASGDNIAPKPTKEIVTIQNQHQPRVSSALPKPNKATSVLDSKVVSSYANVSMTRDTSDQHQSFYNLVQSERMRLLSMSKLNQPAQVDPGAKPKDPQPLQKDKIRLKISTNKSRQHLLQKILGSQSLLVDHLIKSEKTPQPAPPKKQSSYLNKVIVMKGNKIVPKQFPQKPSPKASNKADVSCQVDPPKDPPKRKVINLKIEQIKFSAQPTNQMTAYRALSKFKNPPTSNSSRKIDYVQQLKYRARKPLPQGKPVPSHLGFLHAHVEKRSASAFQNNLILSQGFNLQTERSSRQTNLRSTASEFKHVNGKLVKFPSEFQLQTARTLLKSSEMASVLPSTRATCEQHSNPRTTREVFEAPSQAPLYKVASMINSSRKSHKEPFNFVASSSRKAISERPTPTRNSTHKRARSTEHLISHDFGEFLGESKLASKVVEELVGLTQQQNSLRTLFNEDLMRELNTKTTSEMETDRLLRETGYSNMVFNKQLGQKISPLKKYSRKVTPEPSPQQEQPKRRVPDSVEFLMSRDVRQELIMKRLQASFPSFDPIVKVHTVQDHLRRTELFLEELVTKKQGLKQADLIFSEVLQILDCGVTNKWVDDLIWHNYHTRISKMVSGLLQNKNLFKKLAANERKSKKEKELDEQKKLIHFMLGCFFRFQMKKKPERG